MDNTNSLFNLSPMSQTNLKARMEAIDQLKSSISTIQSTFQRYVDIGLETVQVIGTLGRAFHDFEKLYGDRALSNVTNLIEFIKLSQQQFFVRLAAQIIQPLDSFIENEIADAENARNHATQEYNNYSNLLDRCSAQAPDKAAADALLKNGVLMAAHWKAVQSAFTLSRCVELVERKKLLNVSETFITFINITSQTYRECLNEIDQATESVGALQLAIPETRQHVKAFKDNTKKLAISLEGFYRMYWKRTDAEFPGTDSLNNEGYVWKMTQGLTTKWSRRYLICQKNALSFYKQVGDSWELEGVIHMLLSSAKTTQDPKKGFSFTIITQEQTYVFQTLHEWDMREWVAVIHNNIQYLLDNSGRKTDPATDTFKNTQLSQPFNAVCADCGSSNPSWCVINWGVYICIQCGGVHRSLTTSVSKVRSLTLDKLDPILLDLLGRLGNKKSNGILEANVGVQKITPGASKQMRESYIEMKYRDRAFVPQKPQIDLRESILEGKLLEIHRAICLGQVQYPQNCFGCLHLAASIGDTKILMLLGLNAPDLNALDAAGWSALSYAAYYGHGDAIEVLISLGCDPNASVIAHPYLIALSKHNDAIANIILPFWRGTTGKIPSFSPPVQLPMLNSREERGFLSGFDLIGSL